MEHVEQIQEIVDENKEDMPTGVVTAIMKSCQEAYHALPRLYKLETVRLVIEGGTLSHYHETLIVEQCSAAEWADLAYASCTSFDWVMRHRKMPVSALHWKLPQVTARVFGGKVLERVVIVSISPYGKRSRAE